MSAPATASFLGPASLAAGRRLAEAARLAAGCAHTDAAEHLSRRREELVGAQVRVAVVGEFKQGKSTLVNALVRTDVCPVDEDVVTVLPTVLRWGPQARAVAVAGDDRRPIDLADVPAWVCGESGADGVREVEVHLDRALLRRGLTLVDTPGVGGLDSAHGHLTRATLTGADAALFVTDASQELTAPELDFLEDALTRCPVTLVLTKTDLFAHWPRILELDRGHLAGRGLDVRTLAVSSFLRMRAAATGDRDLNVRSGYAGLLATLTRGVLADADTRLAERADHEVRFVTRQLAEHLEAEREVLRHGDRRGAVVAGLEESSRRSRELLADDASWSVVLQDGLSDLAKDLSYDLRSRLRRLVVEGEEALSDIDPSRGWSEFEAWARAAAAAAAADHLQLLVEEAEALGRRVAERFVATEESVAVEVVLAPGALDDVTLQAEFQQSRLRQALGAMTAARVTYYGIVVSAAAASTIGAAVLAPAIGIAVGAGAILTRVIVKDERSRQVEARRARARQALRSYVDEVAFVLEKESSDAVRRVQRQLRDDFSRRARLVNAGAERALAAARTAATVPDPQLRLREVDRHRARLAAVAAAVEVSRV